MIDKKTKIQNLILKSQVALSKPDKRLDRQTMEFHKGQSVELLICDPTEIGYKAIINNSGWGLLYKDEVFQLLKKGQHLSGFIKKVRDDGKIDLCLQTSGYETIDGVSEKIMGKLKAQGGFISVTDKSLPEIIYSLFGVSKKTYKKAVGALYKKRLISIESNGIRLIKNS